MTALFLSAGQQAPGAMSLNAGYLWAQALLIAEARRSGRVNVEVHGLEWSGIAGWALCQPWEAEAQSRFDLLKPLLDRQHNGAPWVIGQLGQSLDGCVATRTGDAVFINGPENIVHLHRLRALCDAVIVGAGTVVADNPQLTTRQVPGPNPTRIVLDPTLRLGAHVASARAFHDGLAPTLLLCDALCERQALQVLPSEQVLAVHGLLKPDQTPDMAVAVKALVSRGLRMLFVEGGGVTVSRFLHQGCLDRLHLAVAPLIIGDGRPGLRFTGSESLADCLRPRSRVHAMGCDQLWDLDLSPLPASPHA